MWRSPVVIHKKALKKTIIIIIIKRVHVISHVWTFA